MISKDRWLVSQAMGDRTPVARDRGVQRRPRAARRLAMQVLAAAALAATLLAAPAIGSAAPGRRQPAAGPTGAPAAGKREQIKRKLLALRAFRLTEELALDEATAARLFPLLTKYDSQLEQLTIERMTLAKQLRSGPAGAAADEIINRAVANRRALLDLEEKRLAELRKVLTPQQTARLLVVLPEIENQIKRQIRQIVRKRARGDARGNDDLVDPFARDRATDDPLEEME